MLVLLPQAKWRRVLHHAAGITRAGYLQPSQFLEMGLLSFSVAMAMIGVASACTCLPIDPDASTCRGEYVLLGEGVTNEAIDCNQRPVSDDASILPIFPFDRTLAEFRVKTVFSQPEGGTLGDGDIVQVRSSTQSAACGFQVQPGTEYILYANASPADECEAPDRVLDLTTSICAGNVAEPSPEAVRRVVDDCQVDAGPTCEEECGTFCSTRCRRKCGDDSDCGTTCLRRCSRRCLRTC